VSIGAGENGFKKLAPLFVLISWLAFPALIHLH
jgi:hypothetical protein